MVAIDMSQAIKPPPRKAGTRGPGRPKAVAPDPTPVQPTNVQRRTEGLTGIAQLGQGLCIMMGQFADAGAIGQYGPPLAAEVANIAELEEAAWLARGIDVVIAMGPYTAALAVVIPFAMQIMANHGRIDASRLAGQGIVPPEVLASRMKANVATMQMQALREQREAEESYLQAQQDYEDLKAERQHAANGVKVS